LKKLVQRTLFELLNIQSFVNGQVCGLTRMYLKKKEKGIKKNGTKK